MWHPSLNGALTPQDVSGGTGKKVWWQCEKKHEWQASVANITRKKSSCPYCSGRKAIIGENDLQTTHPLIAAKWHPTKNAILSPSDVKYTSSRKVWWQCSKGHEWKSVISTQTDTSCPYCYGRYVITGENDLATMFPSAVEEWHPTKNGDLRPDLIMPYTPKRVWWQCKEGHEWFSSPNSRFAKSPVTGCPTCKGKQIVQGFNDLATTHPEIAAEWHPVKNAPLLPTQITKGHDSSLWWQCKEGHEWKTPTYARTGNNGTNCPMCSAKRVIVGVTDLLTLNPSLSSEWHPTKNQPLSPGEVAAYSSLKVWWLCSRGHEWEAVVASRHQGRNCGKCNSYFKASQGEKTLAAFIESLGLDILRHDKAILRNGLELDIYVPEKRIAVEYNGLYWHTESHGGKDKYYHHKKWLACKDAGIQLIQIWEDEWNRNPEQVKCMLAHKLGSSNEMKVYARKTQVVELGKQEAETFLRQNHIQGFASGSHYIGLQMKVDSSLVAVLVLKNEPNTGGRVLNIIRYATNANVVGGFTKLLKHSDRIYQPDSYITFADHCVSDGGLYANNGFIADKELPPDYTYLRHKERQHKFGYRIQRFKNDPDLLWQDGLTERQLAILNGLDRIWDAGKTRYIRKRP